MAKQFFGTDGIRGRVGQGALTAPTMLRLAQAAGQYFAANTSKAPRVVIGKDTRLSGDMIESALSAGFTAAGMDVVSLGVLPTPAVALAAQAGDVDLGVMITASHNPFHDNGVKFFGGNGCKLGDEAELAIEALMGTEAIMADVLGRICEDPSARGKYVESLIKTFPKDLSLSDLSIVLDCANGAAVETAPQILAGLSPI